MLLCSTCFEPNVQYVPTPCEALGLAPAARRGGAFGVGGPVPGLHEVSWSRHEGGLCASGRPLDFPLRGVARSAVSAGAAGRESLLCDGGGLDGLVKPIGGKAVARVMQDGTKLCQTFQHGQCKGGCGQAHRCALVIKKQRVCGLPWTWGPAATAPNPVDGAPRGQRPPLKGHRISRDCHLKTCPSWRTSWRARTRPGQRPSCFADGAPSRLIGLLTRVMTCLIRCGRLH